MRVQGVNEREELVNPFDKRCLEGTFIGSPGDIYADHTGEPPIAHTLADAHNALIKSRRWGNPHSSHGPSRASAEKIEEARAAILRFFNADPAVYAVVLGSNASWAIHTLRHLDWRRATFARTVDNHNSVNGLREVAAAHRARNVVVPMMASGAIDEERLAQTLAMRGSGGLKLFAYPGKSNASGRVHGFEPARLAQEAGWVVLLDAAALAANDRIDLGGDVKPEFVSASLYKICGHPTGVGALLVRRDAFELFRRRCFAGGTVKFVGVKDPGHVLDEWHAGLEDGTPNFLGLLGVPSGLEWVNGLGPIKDHARAVARSLYDRLVPLRDQGRVQIYSQPEADLVTFALVRDGRVEDPEKFEHAADARQIFVRSGCFCNPGMLEHFQPYIVRAERALRRRREELTRESIMWEAGQGVGAIRASFGYGSRSTNGQAIADFVEEYLDR